MLQACSKSAFPRRAEAGDLLPRLLEHIEEFGPDTLPSRADLPDFPIRRHLAQPTLRSSSASLGASARTQVRSIAEIGLAGAALDRRRRKTPGKRSATQRLKRPSAPEPMPRETTTRTQCCSRQTLSARCFSALPRSGSQRPTGSGSTSTSPRFSASGSTISAATGQKKYVAGFASMLALEPQSMARFRQVYPDGWLISILREPFGWYASVKHRARDGREDQAIGEEAPLWRV